MRLRSEYFPVSLFRNNSLAGAESRKQAAELPVGFLSAYVRVEQRVSLASCRRWPHDKRKSHES